MKNNIFPLVVALGLLAACAGIYFYFSNSHSVIIPKAKTTDTLKTLKKTSSPQDVSVKSGKLIGTKEQLKEREKAISKGPYAVLVADFNSGNQGLKRRADELFNQQDFIDKTNKTLLDHKEVTRDELLAALEIVNIRLDPEHESGLRKIIKEGISEAKIVAMGLLVRLVQKQAIDALIEQKKSSNEKVRVAASALLIKLGVGEQAMPGLIKALSSKSGRIRANAWRNLLKSIKDKKTLAEVKASGYDPRRAGSKQKKNIMIIEKVLKIQVKPK